VRGRRDARLLVAGNRQLAQFAATKQVIAALERAFQIRRAGATNRAYGQFIVGFRCEAIRRLGDAMRSRFGDRMKTSRKRSESWVFFFVVGAVAWFALWAAYGYLVNS
jgi:hypothetical protein